MELSNSSGIGLQMDGRKFPSAGKQEIIKHEIFSLILALGVSSVLIEQSKKSELKSGLCNKFLCTVSINIRNHKDWN